MHTVISYVGESTYPFAVLSGDASEEAISEAIIADTRKWSVPPEGKVSLRFERYRTMTAVFVIEDDYEFSNDAYAVHVIG